MHQQLLQLGINITANVQLSGQTGFIQVAGRHIIDQAQPIFRILPFLLLGKY